MSYPSRLVPKATDIKITDLTPILEDVLCRWVSPGTKLKDQQSILSSEAVEEKRFFGYSTNKIPPSVVDDIFIGFHDTTKFNQEWKEGEQGVTPLDQEYYSDQARGYFFFKIKDIHNYESKYPFPADAKDLNYVFKVQVLHKPLIANYPHFEFDISCYEIHGANVAKIVPPSQKSTSRKIILADLRQHLIKKSKFSLEDFTLEAE